MARPGGAGGPVGATVRAVRRATGVLLIVLAVLLAPVAVAVGWLRAEVLDTDSYVATMSTVLDDPGVQTAVGDAVGDLVTERLLDRLGSADATTDLGAIGQAVQVPVSRLVQGYVREAAVRVVGSDAVGTVWATANRTAHAELIALARDEDGLLVLDRGSDEAELRLPVASLVTAVQDRLALDGLPDLGAVVPDDAQVVLLSGDALVEAVDAVHLLDQVGRWAPWAVLALALVGVALLPGAAGAGRGTGATGTRGAGADGADGVAGAVGGTSRRRDRVRLLVGSRLRAVGWTGAALAVWSAACGLAVGAAADRAPDLVAGLAGDWGDVGSAVTTALLEAWGGGLTGLLTWLAVGGLLATAAGWAVLVWLGGAVRRRTA